MHVLRLHLVSINNVGGKNNHQYLKAIMRASVPSWNNYFKSVEKVCAIKFSKMAAMFD